MFLRLTIITLVVNNVVNILHKFLIEMSADIVSWYWTIALMVFIYWLMLFWQDTSTSKIDPISWLVLLIAPLFWPIVLPICSWELNRKYLKNLLP